MFTRNAILNVFAIAFVAVAATFAAPTANACPGCCPPPSDMRIGILHHGSLHFDGPADPDSPADGWWLLAPGQMPMALPAHASFEGRSGTTMCVWTIEEGDGLRVINAQPVEDGIVETVTGMFHESEIGWDDGALDRHVVTVDGAIYEFRQGETDDDLIGKTVTVRVRLIKVTRFYEDAGSQVGLAWQVLEMTEADADTDEPEAPEAPEESGAEAGTDSDA